MPLIEVDAVRLGVTKYLLLVSGIAGALFLALASDAAHAEKRIALIIGNSDYRNVARLPNPEKDAAQMYRSSPFGQQIGYSIGPSVPTQRQADRYLHAAHALLVSRPIFGNERREPLPTALLN